MQRIVSVISAMVIVAFFMGLTFTASGCKEEKKTTTTTATPKPGDKATTPTATAKAFTASEKAVTLKALDAMEKVTFTNGDPDSVTPTDNKDVSATVKDKGVEFKQLTASPTADKTVDFTVKGGKDKKEEVKITVTVAKKQS